MSMSITLQPVIVIKALDDLNMKLKQQTYEAF